MKYRVEYTKKAFKELEKMDKSIRKLILAWIEKNLIDCTNPREFGKGLVGDKSGLWRYRIGDYRLITEIEDDKIVILILSVGHRKKIYK